MMPYPTSARHRCGLALPARLGLSVPVVLGVPVIDSAAIAVKHAEHLIELRNLFGLTHSKVGAYEAPPPGELNDWRLQDQYGLPAASERWVDLR